MAIAVVSCHDIHPSSPGSCYPDPLPKSNTFDSTGSSGSRPLRTPEDEPRRVVWVYDSNLNTTRRMKTTELMNKFGHQNNYAQVYIPMKPGRIPIQAEDDDEGGSPKTVAIRAHISMALRVQRWLGLQKRLYIVDTTLSA